MNRIDEILSYRRTVLLVVSFGALFVGILDHYSPLVFDGPLYRQPAPNSDAAFFEHIGWYMTQGAKPYIDIWDIKPPFAAFELTYLVALVSGGNMYLNHFFHLLVMATMWIGSVLLVAETLLELVGESSLAPLIGGLVTLVYPAYYLEPIDGFRTKTVLVFLGVLSLLLLLKQRFFWSGLAAALAALSWQPGIAFPVILVVEAYRSSKRYAFRYALYGIVAGTVFVLGPILYWGSFLPMVVQTIVVPALLGDGVYPVARFWFALDLLHGSVLFVVAGFVGSLWILVRKASHQWWLAAGLLIFLAHVLFLDLDSYPDLIPLMLFTGLVVGVLSEDLEPRSQRVLVFILFLFIPLNAFSSYLPCVGPLGTGTMDSRKILASVKRGIYVGPLENRGSQQSTVSLADREDLTMSEIYWHKIRPESCHYRASGIELEWIDLTQQASDAERCGRRN